VLAIVNADYSPVHAGRCFVLSHVTSAFRELLKRKFPQRFAQCEGADFEAGRTDLFMLDNNFPALLPLNSCLHDNDGLRHVLGPPLVESNGVGDRAEFTHYRPPHAYADQHNSNAVACY